MNSDYQKNKKIGQKLGLRLTPLAVYYIVGLFNPVTSLPAAIGAAATGLACVIVSEIGEKDKMGKMRKELTDKLNKKEEEDKKQNEKIQKQKEELQRFKERLDRLRKKSTKQLEIKPNFT